MAGRTIVVAAMALFLISSIGHSPKADEGEAPINRSEVQVPLRDLRGAEADAVEAIASASSKDAQVIVFFGDNYDAYKSMVEALQEVITEGEIAFRGVILADPLEARIVHGYQISMEQEIAIYADAQLTSTIRNPNAEVGEAIKDQLQRDYERIILPRRGQKAEAED